MKVHKPGYFNDGSREYRILDMYPPRPWNNLLWNESLICDVSQFGCGKSALVHRGARVTLAKGDDDRLFYLRDEQSGECWSPNRNFRKERFDEFYTDVGQGYSIIHSRHRQIGFSFQIFVAEEGPQECWSVEVANAGKLTRKLSLYAYAEPDIYLSEHHAYDHGCFHKPLNGVVLSHRGFSLPTDYTTAFFASDVRPVAYETTNRRFRGVYGSLHAPDALTHAKLASADTSFDAQMAAVLQFTFTLKPGQKKRLNFMLGLARSTEEAVAVRTAGLSSRAFATALAQIAQKNETSICQTWLESPDAEINSMANIWLKRQVSFGKTWGRGYNRGFRDIMQDITGFVSLDPITARAKILYCLEHQFLDGNTLRSWDPLNHHPYRDGASWIVPTVNCFIKETGDFSFLDETVKFYDGKKKESVLEHCRRGMDFLLGNLGQHGLCLWGGGDWNDSINNPGLKLKGESVWLSEATVKSALEFVELLEISGHRAEAAAYARKAARLSQNTRKHGWDKDHFICGYTDWGEKVGAHENREGRIFLNMQTWAVLGDVVTGQAAAKLLDFVEKELGCPFGYVLAKPSYTKPDEHIGRVTYFEPGAYENGSVYNHGVAFKIAADCRMGRGNQAYASIKKILGGNPKNPAARSGMEPYAISNMYLGPENQLRAGEAVMGWITGTAPWLFRCIMEFMAGVRADYDGLRIAPCLPAAWKVVKITRKFRGACYRIHILNPRGLQTGRCRLTVDGRELDSDVLPVFQDGRAHEVRVELVADKSKGY